MENWKIGIIGGVIFGAIYLFVSLYSYHYGLLHLQYFWKQNNTDILPILPGIFLNINLIGKIFLEKIYNLSLGSTDIVSLSSTDILIISIIGFIFYFALGFLVLFLLSKGIKKIKNLIISP